MRPLQRKTFLPYSLESQQAASACPFLNLDARQSFGQVAHVGDDAYQGPAVHHPERVLGKAQRVSIARQALQVARASRGQRLERAVLQERNETVLSQVIRQLAEDSGLVALLGDLALQLRALLQAGCQVRRARVSSDVPSGGLESRLGERLHQCANRRSRCDEVTRHDQRPPC